MKDQTLPVPLDVRLMSMTATVLFAIVAAMLATGGVLWVLRHPWFSITSIHIQGDVAHLNEPTLRANITPKLRGNFFTMDLDEARKAFEEVPWVRSAVVWREFPNQLMVKLQEHQPVAAWGGEGDSRMLNTFGEVFDTSGVDVDTEDLPRLTGPQGQPQQMLEMYRALFPVLRDLGANLVVLELSDRGSWRVQLSNETVVELGRGTPAEVLERTRRFMKSVHEITARYGRNPTAIEAADLRYTKGYALRLRGVTTSAPAAPVKVAVVKAAPAVAPAKPSAVPAKPNPARPAGARR